MTEYAKQIQYIIDRLDNETDSCQWVLYFLLHFYLHYAVLSANPLMM